MRSLSCIELHCWVAAVSSEMCDLIIIMLDPFEPETVNNVFCRMITEKSEFNDGTFFLSYFSPTT